MLPTPLARAPRPLRRSPRPAALAGAVLAAGLLASALAPAAASANPFATLYKDARHKGGALQVTGDIPQLSAFGFNDATSSARLYGEPLAVFKDADYKGACFTVRGDVPSFNDAGFGNDNLSSVRVHFTCEDGPLDVDACAAAPCAAGQLCVDLPRPAPRSAAGRQCVTWTAPERPRASAPGALDPPNLARSGSAPENLARGRAARQSSTYGTASASLAVDGNANGNFSSGSVTHTQTEPAAWLEVALGEPRAVASVRLHNRTDGSTERILGVYVTLSDVGCDQVAAEPIARSAPIAANAAVHTLSFDGEPRARFVCVRRSTPGPLSLAELEVLAPTRTLPNLARSKAARVVPSYGGHSPALLTDGDTRGSYSAGSVVHTQDTPGNFIEVDLGALREVATVILHNRTDCCGERLSSAVLELSATPCDATPRAPVAALELLHSDYSPIVAAHLPAPASGRYLCLRQAGAVPTNIAEIEAYGPEDERLRLPARARQSSVGLGGTPDRVNDGQTSGHWLHGSVNHTAPASSDAVSGDSAPWVEVDLQATRRVGRVMVYNRTDGSTQRLTGARLELSLDPCNNPARRVVRDEQLTVFNRHERVPPAIGAAGYNAMEAAVREGRVKPFLGGVSPPVQALDFLEAPAARYVCLRHDVAHFLHVAEIEVYEGEPAENLARRPGVATRQLSVAHDGDAARAVDGLRWGNYDAATITHTDGAAGRWWEADLGAPQAIRAVAVFNRTDCCGERLLGAVVEASLDPCDLATRRVVKSLPIPIAPIDNAWIRRPPYATGAGATSRDLPLRRTELSLAGTPAARYVCVRQPRAQALSLAEVEIYGFGTAAPAPPAPVPALADALAATPPVAPPAPPALSATTAQGVTQISVGFGPAGSLSCTLAPRGAELDLACLGAPPVAMTGTVAGPAYDLRATTAASFATLTQAPWFPPALRDASGLFAPLADLFGASELRLALSSERGFYLTGTLDLANLPGAGPVRDAIAKVTSTLGRAVGAPLSLTPTFELVPSFSATGVALALRLNVLETCAGPAPVPAIGTAFAFERGAVVFAIAAGAGGLAVTAGLEGQLYLKPSSLDPWLRVNPGIDLGATTQGGTLAVRGALSGACPAECATRCGCTAAQCAAPWHPLGMGQLALRGGFLELGVATAGPVPLPAITAAFEDARVGDLQGSFALSLDPGAAKSFGFRFGARRLPLFAALEIFGGLAGVESVLPKALALDRPLISFATLPMTIHGAAVPAGLRLRGGVDLGALGLGGSVDATLNPAQGLNLASLVSGAGLAGALPSGALAIDVQVPDLAGLVVKVGRVPSFVRTVIEGTFWVTRLGVGLSFGANGFSVRADSAFRLLGEQHTFGFELGASWDLDKLVKGLAGKVAGLIGDVAAQAFSALKGAAETAYRETTDALAKGGSVVIGGVVTYGSVAVEASAEALGTVGGYLQKGWNKFVDGIGSLF